MAQGPNTPRRWADLGELKTGATASTTFVVEASLIRATADLTGDINAIHLDRDAARAIGQSRPLAHGAILVGALSRVIGTELPGHGSVWFKSDLEFQAPFYEGDSVTLALTVGHISLVTRVVVLDVVGTTAAGSAVLRGRVSVRVPERVAAERSYPMSDQDRVTIVTGASRGVGQAVAEALAPAGGHIVVAYRDDHAAAAATVASVEERGGKAVAVAADFGQPDAAEAIVMTASRTFGRVDAIVHCATPPIERKPFLESSAADFRTLFDTYVIALADLARLTAPGMKERRHGRIVAILSSAIAEAPPKLAAYTTAKHAVLGLCRSLAVELGPWDITVNAVSPSLVIGRHADELGAAGREAVARRTPLRRLAESGDVAGSVRFLLSDEAKFISGANLPVTGGLLF